MIKFGDSFVKVGGSMLDYTGPVVPPEPPEPTANQYFMFKLIDSFDSQRGQTGKSQGHFQISEFQLFEGSTKAVLSKLADSGNATSGQDSSKLFDGSTSTKWCPNIYPYESFSPIRAWFICKAGSPINVQSYKMATADDTSQWYGRNPYSWEIYGSNTESTDPDSASWKLITKKTGDTTMQAVNYTYYTFDV